MDTRTESSRERVVLALIDTFFPRSKPPTLPISTILTPEELSRFYAFRGSDSAGIALRVLENIETRLPSDVCKDLFFLFWLLNTRLGTLILGGRAACSPVTPTAFTDLPRTNRERILLNWSQSSTVKFRKAFIGIKGLLLSTLFTSLDPNGTSPLLTTLKYQVSPQRPLEPLPQALEAEKCITSSLVDLCGHAMLIDGSPAGVARAAAALAAKGLPVHWPGHNPPAPHRISSAIAKTKPAFIVSTDAIIVGSGAGGGVTAALLAESGLNVIVLEKSTFVPAKLMTLQEGEAFGSMYDYSGLLTTESGSTSVLAGSTLGGGTRINWNASFKTPLHVRKEWVEEHGLSVFTSEEYDVAVETVCKRLGVRTGFAHGGACSALAAGLKASGMDCGDVPRNCLDLECSGHCCFGCARGAKQDTVNTFLADACSTGNAKIVTGAWAESIILEKTTKESDARKKNGRFKQAAGVLVRVGPSCNPLRIAFSAPIVISCAGAIQTPALMLRSSIFSGGNVGSNLRLHPCTCVVGIFPLVVKIPPYVGENGCSRGVPSFCGATPSGSIRCSEGAIMSVFSRHGAEWETSGYGYVLYTPATHPGLFAAAAPWLGGTAYKELMVQYPNAVPILVLVRDSGNGGTVVMDKEGRPRLQYSINQQDRAMMVEGMKAGLHALIAAGATSVITLANSQDGRYDVNVSEKQKNSITPTSVVEERLSHPSFQAYLQRVKERGVVDLQMATFSAHQMGTARLGISAETSVVDPAGESWEVANLYCCDGSTFPTSLGINPMVTIESVAYVLAGKLAVKEQERKRMNNYSNRVAVGEGDGDRKSSSRRGAVKVEYGDDSVDIEIVGASASAKL